MNNLHRQELIKNIEKSIDSLALSEVSIDSILSQIETFEKGVKPLSLEKPALIGDGIVRISESEFDYYLAIHTEAASRGRLTEFIPASGAATRMFRKIISVYNDPKITNMNDLRKAASAGGRDAEGTLEFIENFEKFAFYGTVKGYLKTRGKDPEKLIAEGDFKQILKVILSEDDLSFEQLPKGLIEFHNYNSGPRTPIEEHMIESSDFLSDKFRTCRLHFTVSPSAKDLILRSISRYLYNDPIRGFDFDITTSVQKRSTDTIAVGMDNLPYRDSDNNFIFRPAGHGALLENLNELSADIVHIKNIDNILPDTKRNDSVLYKKLLCGYLVEIQEETFNYLDNIDSVPVDKIIEFAKNKLNINLKSGFSAIDERDQRNYLFKKMNRPIRVCGMVVNEGHPGGGPFWVADPEGSSLQIVEATQIDSSDPEQYEILAASTHFNPVDLVCGVKNHKGENFDLLEFRNPGTAFISEKSHAGTPIKALELPGLWNGGMYYWNTIFVEVPKSTFAPVKEVNDLLREEHQP